MRRGLREIVGFVSSEPKIQLWDRIVRNGFLESRKQLLGLALLVQEPQDRREILARGYSLRTKVHSLAKEFSGFIQLPGTRVSNADLLA